MVNKTWHNYSDLNSYLICGNKRGGLFYPQKQLLNKTLAFPEGKVSQSTKYHFFWHFFRRSLHVPYDCHFCWTLPNYIFKEFGLLS